jgi:hypothetical protein
MGALSLLVAAPNRVTAARFAEGLASAGVESPRVERIGSHAERYQLNEARSGVFAPRS